MCRVLIERRKKKLVSLVARIQAAVKFQSFPRVGWWAHHPKKYRYQVGMA
jgi:hypothetical protein